MKNKKTKQYCTIAPFKIQQKLIQNSSETTVKNP